MSLVFIFILKLTLFKIEVGIYYFCLDFGEGKYCSYQLAIISLWFLLLGGYICVWSLKHYYILSNNIVGTFYYLVYP